MDKLEIETKVIEIIALQFGVEREEVNLKTHFQNELEADSLDAVEIVMMTEDRFDINIDTEESDTLVTVELLVDYVYRRLQDNSS